MATNMNPSPNSEIGGSSRSATPSTCVDMRSLREKIMSAEDASELIWWEYEKERQRLHAIRGTLSLFIDFDLDEENIKELTLMRIINNQTVFEARYDWDEARFLVAERGGCYYFTITCADANCDPFTLGFEYELEDYIEKLANGGKLVYEDVEDIFNKVFDDIVEDLFDAMTGILLPSQDDP